MFGLPFKKPKPIDPSPQPPAHSAKETSLSPTMTPQSQVAQLPKKSFPKKILFIPVLLLILLIVAAIAKNIKPAPVEVGDSNTITWWEYNLDQKYVQPLIDEYKSMHPEVVINFVSQTKQDYRERLTSALAQNKGPDVFSFHQSWLPMFNSQLDRLPESVMSSEEFSQTFYPVFATDLSSGSGMYGIPLQYDAMALFVNRDIFDRYGRDIPTTWDDLKPIALEMTARNELKNIVQAGIDMGATEHVDHWEETVALLMLQNGVRMSAIDDPLTTSALSFYGQFAGKTPTWDEALPNSTMAFADGKLAMFLAPTYRVQDLQIANPSLRFRVAGVPQIPEDPLVPRPKVTYSTYWVEGVWNRSRGKNLAWDFLKFISSRESLTKIYAAAAADGVYIPPSPRVDMKEEGSSDPIARAILAQVDWAKSWYLASNTNDGITGINSQLSTVFKEAVLPYAGKAGHLKEALGKLVAGVAKVLSQYAANPQS